MKLPHGDSAFIADAKLVAYLLNLDHPDGGPKARFFLGVGFKREEPETLRQALLGITRSADMTPIALQRGTKYIGIGQLTAPNGRVYRILTAWALDDDLPPPRFISAYPVRRAVR